jgi:hypothetical protein
MSTEEEEPLLATSSTQKKKKTVLLQRIFTSTFVSGTCAIMIFTFLWALGLIVWFYWVHMQIIFAHSDDGFVFPSNIPYWNKPGPIAPGHGPIRLAQTEILSWAWWIYASDLFLILAVFSVPTGFILGVICKSFGWFVVTVPVVLGITILLELAKSLFFGITWASNLLCSEYPFCINRSTSTDFVSADTLFIVECIATFISLFFAIGLLIGSYCIFRDGEHFRELSLSANSKWEPPSAGGGGKRQPDSFRFSSSRSERDVIVAEPVFCEAQEDELRAEHLLRERHTKKSNSNASKKIGAHVSAASVVATADNSHEAPPRLYLTRENNLKNL